MSAPEPVRGWIVLSIVALLCLAVPLPEQTVETLYARDMYPWLQTGFTSISNLAPFAVLDVLLVIGAVLLALRLWRTLLIARDQGLFNAVWELLRRGVRAVAILVILFLWAWGFNYRRPPLEATVPGADTRPTMEELDKAFTASNVLAARLRPTIAGQPALSDDELFRELQKPFGTALAHIGRPPLSVPGRPKHSIVLTRFFTKAGVDGMLNPLALESIVHSELLPFERPFVLAHEWAHLAGQADEAEASAVGWLACMYGGPQLAYSASLYLIGQAQAAMPAAMRRAALGKIHPDVRADLAEIAERLRKEDPRVQRAAFRIYDEYLKANRVEDGQASYGRALTLILTGKFQEPLAGYR
jgi:hypothetical protein